MLAATMRIPPLALLSNILRAAARAGDAVGGTLQIVESGALRILIHHGLPVSFRRHFEVVGENDGSACAQAFRDRRRIVIRDMETDAAFAPHLATARAAGLRAVQSTPLLDKRRKLIGMLSTHFAVPYHPTPAGFERIDVCASIAARLLEIHRMHDAIVSADNELGMSGRALSPLASQGSDAAQQLLRAAPDGDEPTMLEAADRHLGVIVEELEALFTRYRTARLADRATTH